MKELKKHRGRLFLRIIGIAVCLAVFLFSLFNVISIIQNYREIDKTYDEAAGQFTEIPSQTSEEESGGIGVPEVDFDALLQVNNDVIGWIYIEGTDISYPLLCGRDNQQYLFQSYEKKYLTAGSIFIDYRCSRDFTDSRMVVYGHNMHNGSMFGKLDKFTKESYMKKHLYVYILLPGGETLKYEVKKTYKADIEGEVYKLPSGEAKDSEDRKLYLSTCTEDSSDTQRFVVECDFAESEAESRSEKQ
ncbi:MAG: class B sortase [Firmicutes bacterium]|nr:class B sortase [Bacillota bacterium]